mgnify:CR=1 FL=1|jgi:DNA-binding transcriptional LysR family regulator
MLGEKFATNLEYYKVFFYVATYGSITAAAERLFVSQPNVSKSIQKLEEQLGCQLFARTKRGMILTAEGQVLWERVAPACQLILAAENELETMKSPDGGTLSIASTEMGFKTYVLPALSLLLTDHPNVKIRFVNALNAQILEMLEGGMIDLAILHSPLEMGDTIASKTIDVIQECFIAGPRYAHLGQKAQHLAELKKYPFISMPEGSSGKRYLTDVFRQHGLIFEADIEVTSIELTIQAVESNFGIGILPERIVKKRIEAKSLFHIPTVEILPERRAYVLRNRDFPVSSTAKAFVDNYLLPLTFGEGPKS